MDTKKELPQRKPLRLRDFNYSVPRAYFITVCTQGKRKILSRIVGGDVPDAPNKTDLLPCGKIVDKYINQLHHFYDNAKVERYVIMPNHIHMMLFVLEDGASRTSPPTPQHSTVSRFVSTLKRFCNKEHGGNLWQRGFHDHIIRDREDLERHLRYIGENPLHWERDELYVQE